MKTSTPDVKLEVDLKRKREIHSLTNTQYSLKVSGKDKKNVKKEIMKRERELIF